MMIDNSLFFTLEDNETVLQIFCIRLIVMSIVGLPLFDDLKHLGMTKKQKPVKYFNNTVPQCNI